MTTITLPRATVEQALEALTVLLDHLDGVPADKVALADWIQAEADLRAALARQAEPVPTQRINSWGFCGVCRHDRIPGEGCARQECPDSPQQAEPVPPFPPVSQWKQGCAVCGIGNDGKAYGYVCPRSDCPTKVTCGGVA